MTFIRKVGGFVTGTARMAFLGGNRMYYAWLSVLVLCIGQALFAYAHQFEHGLISTHMRDSVSWGFYIGNFTFLVGVAAAAVLLVIPAYVYNWKPIKEVVLFGEMLAVVVDRACACSSCSWTWGARIGSGT